MPIRESWRRLKHLFTRDRIASALDDEMQLHLEMRAARNRALGMSHADAELDAKRRFGNRTVLREEGREASGWLLVERFAQDVRYGTRQLRRNPLFTATTVVVLALGIGANTAMFSLLEAALFAPAPVSGANRLVWVAEHQPASGRVRGLSFPDYLTIRDARTPLAGAIAYTSAHFALGGGEPERISGFVASGNYFNILGVRAAIGRTFGPEEDAAPGAHMVAVMSDGLWKRRFGADPAIVNRPIVLNGSTFTVVGVLPAGFAGVELNDAPMDIWVPISTIHAAMPGNDRLLVEPGSAWLRVIGRLQDGSSVTQANAALGALDLPSHPARSTTGLARVTTAMPIAGGFDPSNRRQMVPILGLLAIVPALVLLIAAANAANLMLARGIDRRKELAVRRSLGASRGRIVRQLLTEAVMLGLIAGAASLVLARGLIEGIRALGQVPPVILSWLVIDPRVLAATAVTALATGIAFALVPALAASRLELSPALKEGAASLTATPGRGRLQSVFVSAQIAVSLVLLVMTGAFMRGISRATHVDPGFDVDHGAAISFNLELQGYDVPRQASFASALLDRAGSMPGIEASALTTFLPLGNSFFGTDVRTDSEDGSTAAGRQVSALSGSVSPRYFDVMGTRITAGRAFDRRDTTAAPLVAIVSDGLARWLWPEANPVGKRIAMAGTHQPWRTVVGVASEVKDDDITAAPRASIYLPLEQEWAGELTLVARSADPRGSVTSMTAAAHAIDPNLPVVDARTFGDLIAGAVDKQRAVSSVIAGFGAVALFLAVIGLYGVASHAAKARTREVAIRIALGARPADVRGLFVWQGLARSVAGIVIGLAASAASAKIVASLLFGFGASDVIEFVAAASMLAVVAMLASYLPARRAANVDPLIALRAE